MLRPDFTSPRLLNLNVQSRIWSKLFHIPGCGINPRPTSLLHKQPQESALVRSVQWIMLMCGSLVFQAIQQKGEQHRAKHPMWFDAPACDTDGPKLVREREDALGSRELHFQKGAMDNKGDIPTLMGKLKVGSTSGR